MTARIMYIEDGSHGAGGPAWIGRVRYSASGRMLYYRGRTLHRTFEGTHIDIESGETFRIAEPSANGADRRPGETLPIAIDDDVREEYWRRIRRRPERADEHLVVPHDLTNRARAAS